MTQQRRELLPGWRAGLLVLGLYAMLLQAFFAGLAGPSHAAPFEPGVTCSQAAQGHSAGQEPASPNVAHDCVCPALCHSGGMAPGAAAQAFAPVARFADVDLPPAWEHVAGPYLNVAPPARAPPHVGFVIES